MANQNKRTLHLLGRLDLANDTRAGFTLTELLVVIVVVSTALIGIMTMAFSYFSSTSRGQAKANLTIESQTVLRMLSETIRTGSGVAPANSNTDPNHSGWATDDDNNVLILRVPARDNSGDFIPNSDTGYPYQNEIVLFADSTTLYRRMLANSNAPGNQATTTCPSASASSSCPADTILSETFDDMTFTFFDQDNNETTDASLARSLSFSLTLADQAAGGLVTNTDLSRLTFRNNAN